MFMTFKSFYRVVLLFLENCELLHCKYTMDNKYLPNLGLLLKTIVPMPKLPSIFPGNSGENRKGNLRIIQKVRKSQYELDTECYLQTDINQKLIVKKL